MHRLRRRKEEAADRTRAGANEEFGIRFKPPKTKRGFRTIALDDGTVAILAAERSKWLRLAAGIPDGSDIDISLISLPANALIFPALPDAGELLDLGKPHNPRNFSKEFARRAEVIGFGALAAARPARRACDRAPGRRHTHPPGCRAPW
jgi:integrase